MSKYTEAAVRICSTKLLSLKIWQNSQKIPVSDIQFFHKQPDYKQLARGKQIAKQLSGLKPTISEFNCLKSNIGKILKSLIININFES